MVERTEIKCCSGGYPVGTGFKELVHHSRESCYLPLEIKKKSISEGEREKNAFVLASFFDLEFLSFESQSKYSKSKIGDEVIHSVQVGMGSLTLDYGGVWKGSTFFIPYLTKSKSLSNNSLPELVVWQLLYFKYPEKSQRLGRLFKSKQETYPSSHVKYR